jgi:hypothetical protein
VWAPVQTKKNLAVLEVSPDLDIDLFPFKELFERLSRNTSTSRKRFVHFPSHGLVHRVTVDGTTRGIAGTLLTLLHNAAPDARLLLQVAHVPAPREQVHAGAAGPLTNGLNGVPGSCAQEQHMSR